MQVRLMRAACAAVIAAGLGWITSATAQTDPLAPAREGQLQCYAPNIQTKTCQSLGRYTFDAQGAITSTGDVLIAPQPLIVMTVSSPVTVRNGAVCGPLSPEDIERAMFTIDGAPANAAQAQTLRDAIRGQLAGALNAEGCTPFAPDNGGFRTNSTLNGAPRPELTQRMIWVRPNDGWRVGP